MGSTDQVKNRLSKNLFQQLAALTSLLLLIAFFSVMSEYFFTVTNLLTIALQTAVIGIIALGMTYVIITGGIDLSVGSIVAFSGVVTGLAMQAGMPLFVALPLGMLTGTCCGLLNGLLISKANLPPFIATLGMMMTLRGLTLASTKAMPISGFSDTFELIAGGKLFGYIPYPVIYLVIAVIVCSFILKKTTMGKATYAVGSNEEAAKLSGVNVTKVKLFAYGLTGFLCALSAIILTSRLVSAQPTEGAGFEMDAIAAVVIGGASLSGGKGTVIGTVIGAFIMGTLRNGLTMMNVSGYWQQVAVGVVVLFAVYLDQRRKKGQ